MSSTLDPLRQRMQAHRLIGRQFASGAEAVQTLGAVQAQDFAGALWALGQRVEGASEGSLLEAFAGGCFLRTHVLRPTWHLVAPADIRWMLNLSAPRVHAACGYQYRALGLTPATLRKSQTALQKALRGGQALTRDEARAVFKKAGLRLATSLHVIHVLLAAEIDGVVCSGPLRGKQHTYMLLDERVTPAGRRLHGSEARDELARRYFSSHGPATIADLAWWAGLTQREATAATGSVGNLLKSGLLGGVRHWWGEASKFSASNEVFLLPNFDEYVIAYAERSALLTEVAPGRLDGRGHVLFNHALILGGRIAGTWKRSLSRKWVSVAITPFRALTRAEAQRVEEAVAAYGAFLHRDARLILR